MKHENIERLKKLFEFETRTKVKFYEQRFQEAIEIIQEEVREAETAPRF